MYYPLPNTTVTGLVGLLQYSNIVTNYYFGPGVVLAFFVVMFLAMKSFEAEKAFAGSSFLTFVFCFLFYLVDLTTVSHVFLTALAVMLSIIGLKMSEGEA